MPVVRPTWTLMDVRGGWRAMVAAFAALMLAGWLVVCVSVFCGPGGGRTVFTVPAGVVLGGRRLLAVVGVSVLWSLGSWRAMVAVFAALMLSVRVVFAFLAHPSTPEPQRRAFWGISNGDLASRGWRI
ncbi:MAG TPA: hypothetical protein VFY84_19835 [Jiangellales bacterium]|nr:hypothetical protein [Jiangellales bacterium]